MRRANYRFMFVAGLFYALVGAIGFAADQKTFEVSVESLDITASKDGTQIAEDQLPIAGTVVVMEVEPVVASAPSTSADDGGGGGGCFIATAAYGSKLAPEVIRLSQFRDNYLLTNKPGTWFVTQYYAYSPPLAEWLRDHEFIKFFVRLLLWGLVTMLWLLTEATIWIQIATIGLFSLLFIERVRMKNNVTKIGSLRNGLYL